MAIVLINFRVPGGEELTDERLEVLDDLGVDIDQVSADMTGMITVRIEISHIDLDRMVEDRAEEILEALPDMDLVDYEVRE